MGAAFFYHLTRRPMEDTLAVLLEKSLKAGWKVAVQGRDVEQMDWLDRKLWLGSEEGFLPHGLAGGPHDADQPILLTVKPGWANEPDCVMVINGAAIAPDAVNALKRVCVLFDGHDAEAVQSARDLWRSLTGAGCKAQYWSEDSGRWEKKAEA